MRYLIAASLLSASIANAASIRLTWTESNSVTISNPGTVNVYRITAACPSNPSAVKWLHLASNVEAEGPYVDSKANMNYPHCYYITAVINGAESGPSQMVFVPGAPAGLAGAWQK